MTTVAVLFDGAREQTDTSLLAINGGGAKGVAIKLYEHDQTTAVSLGKTTAKQTVTPGSSGGTGTADLEFYADYVSTAATVTAGKADGTANFNMIYN
ncbi:fimbrial protein [Klebsiella pneumoniae]|nr:fimbrial protein [Klebsiella pneumoniae]